MAVQRARVTRRTIRDLSPYQRLQAQERVQALRDGRLSVPERCTYCRGTTLLEDRDYPGNLRCAKCGKLSHLSDITVIRKREIQATILDGPLEDRS